MLEKPKKLNVPAQRETNQVKVMLIGDCQSGKTLFCNRYTTGSFPDYYEATLGVDAFHKFLGGSNRSGETHLTLWDFSGRLDYVELRNEFYKESHVVALFVDSSKLNENDSIEYWVKEAKSNGYQRRIMLVATKVDNKKQSFDKIAKEMGMSYAEVSGKTGEGVDEVISKFLAEAE